MEFFIYLPLFIIAYGLIMGLIHIITFMLWGNNPDYQDCYDKDEDD